MSEWTTAVLDDVCSTITDGAHHSPKEDPTGLPMASVKDLTRYGIELAGCKRISREDFDTLERQGCRPVRGDVLIAKDGNSALDTVCVHESDEDVVLLSSIALLRPNREVLPDFLRYYLDAPATRALLKSGYRSGSAIPRVVLKDFRRAPIAYPEIERQREIVGILRSLDDKIELNRRMNRTLEAIARAIFKSWFVDFDPVIDNAILNGKPIPDEFAKRAEVRREILARSNGGEGVAACRHLFPDSFEDSPLGTIPIGWQVRPIADIAEYANGRNFTKNASGTGRMVIRIAELNRGVSGSTVFNDIAAASENTAYPDDILFAWSGSLGVFRWHGGEALINQHIFKVIPNGLPKWFVYFHLLQAMPYFRMVAAGKATTMGHIKRAHLADVLLSIPPAKLLSAVDEVVGPLYSRVHVVEQETGALERTRDVLLPYLLSGEFASIGGDAFHD